MRETSCKHEWTYSVIIILWLLFSPFIDSLCFNLFLCCLAMCIGRRRTLRVVNVIIKPCLKVILSNIRMPCITGLEKFVLTVVNTLLIYQSTLGLCTRELKTTNVMCALMPAWNQLIYENIFPLYTREV